MLHVDDELPFYVNETLSPGDRARVERHLAGCDHCQQELLFWRSVADTVVEARDMAEAQVAERAPVLPHLPTAIATQRRRSPFRHAMNLLVAQWRLIRWQAALASGIILFAGLLTLPTTLSGAGAPAMEFLRWLAPLATALGISLVYTPVEREMGELLETMPTSPRTILLARLALLYGGNAAVVSLLALCLGSQGVPAAALAVGWLIPMALLSSLAVLVAVVTDATVASAVVSGLWVVLAFSRQLSDQLTNWLTLIPDQLDRPVIALPLIAVQLVVAVWLAGRPQLARSRPV